MSINLGAVEWEKSRKATPSSLGRKLAAALSVLTLAALAMGTWLEAPDLAAVNTEVASVTAQQESSVPLGSQVFTK